jgi:hypothetical protein
MPLVAVAKHTGTAIVLVRHVRKAGGVSAIHRGLGSVAIGNVARCMMMLLRDPNDPDQRVLTWPALNVGPQPKSIRWRYGSAVPGQIPPIQWDEVVCDLTADDILDRQDNRTRPDSAGGAAERFLRDMLADGPVQATDLDERANQEGINARTLKRARQRLGVQAYKMGRTWWAKLPRVPDSHGGTDVPLGTVGPLEEGQEGQERQGSLLGGLSPLARQPGSDDGDGAPSWEASP